MLIQAKGLKSDFGMASSSMAIDVCDDYDVFLSFRGTDTRNNFTSHLYESLRRKNIKAFIDYKIKRGDEITPALERVIEAVKLSIIVFSSDYASSTFCLDELLKIIECKECNSQIVLPIFYKVDPSPSTYEEAFARHEKMREEMRAEGWLSLFWKVFKRHEEETIRQEMKVERWKSAFHKSLELAGWHIDHNSVESEVINAITEEVLKKLNSCQSKGEELICETVVGSTFKASFQEIWKSLMDDKISRVGVYGMGGVGKTTIAARINNQLLASNTSFTHIYWVTVSKDSSTYKLQSDIAKMINLDLSKEDDERKRAAKLQKHLISKKFVLILDDVWEAFEIEDVGIPISVVGGKLLLTSRSLRVCRIMKCETVRIEPLPQQEALDLFMKESEYQIKDSQEWKEIVLSIVEECAGLPLAIVVLARRMRGVVEIGEWRNTLRELQKPDEGENQVVEEKVFKPLKFSYDHLPNDKHRQCLLYCSLFPEDYEFDRGDLVEYWIGEGLIDELDSTQAELDKGHCILDELINSSLLEYEKTFEGFSYVKMHDVIRDMAIFLILGLQFKDPLKRSFTIGCVHVLNHEISKSDLPDLASECSKAKTLLWKGEMELPDCFFTNYMQNLTVLHMHGVDLIPDSITNLGSLKVLILCEALSLERIPSLGGLENLRHLRITKNDNLKEIPKGMERLVNLRVLNLSHNRSLRGSVSSGVLEKLSHLQTLDLNRSRVEVEPKALISVEKLETLRVHFYDLHKLNSYVTSGHWRRLVDYQINYGPYGPEDWKKAMSLVAINDVEEWKEDESGIFLPGNVQYLWSIQSWESPMFSVLRNRTFANLQMLRIWSCKSIYLITVELARWLLHNIKELDIDHCNNLGEIIAIEEEWGSERNCINYPTIVLPKLKILTLSELPNLRSIYRGRMMCPSLESIQFHQCYKLQRLPFCKEEEGNQQNSTIQVQGVLYNYLNSTDRHPISRRWWDSLQWDNAEAKSMYCQDFDSESE